MSDQSLVGNKNLLVLNKILFKNQVMTMSLCFDVLWIMGVKARKQVLSNSAAI